MKFVLAIWHLTDALYPNHRDSPLRLSSQNTMMSVYSPWQTHIELNLQPLNKQL